MPAARCPNCPQDCVAQYSSNFCWQDDTGWDPYDCHDGASTGMGEGGRSGGGGGGGAEGEGDVGGEEGGGGDGISDAIFAVRLVRRAARWSMASWLLTNLVVRFFTWSCSSLRVRL